MARAACGGRTASCAPRMVLRGRCKFSLIAAEFGSNCEGAALPVRHRFSIQPVSVPLRGLCVVGLLWFASIAAAEWLALCSRCVSPTVFSLTGADTANALAQARITRAEIEGWCANWQPGDAACVQRGLQEHDLTKVYRASADCMAGRITPVDGNSYQLAGAWDNKDIGGGRSRWRDASGKIVGRDNASGGLGISQQWEVLCPLAGKRAGQARGPAASARTPTPPAVALKADYTVGQVVMARYGSQWVRAKVNAVRQTKGRNGPELAYDVRLDNGKRGQVPARMLRAM
jgi:hypothetical protein